MQNPFYNSSASSSGPPPTYSRPTPARPAAAAPTSPIGEPAVYSSLADLTKNKPVPPPRPGAPGGFSYTPDPTRIGYSSAGFGSEDAVAGPARADGRRMPPAPSNQGLGVPSEPPRRVANASPVPPNTAAAGATAGAAQRPATGPASYIPASAQGYANTASSYATAGVGKAREGFDSMFTQQRREQVTSNLGKAAAGGAKLLGKGAWQLGKFASNPTGK